jgi:hypothetical protein
MAWCCILQVKSYVWNVAPNAAFSIPAAADAVEKIDNNAIV